MQLNRLAGMRIFLFRAKRFFLLSHCIAAFCASLSACSDGSSSDALRISSDFESASIGEVVYRDHNSVELSLRDDNGDTALPSHWRNWWYIRAENVPRGEEISLSLRNRGWDNYYLPVYSYDQQRWQRLAEEQVSLGPNCAEGPAECTLEITARFEEDTVYLARYYPYSHSRLQDYLAGIEASPFVERSTLGLSPEYGKPIELIRIEGTRAKYAVWLHARTHPAETGGSFFLEGMINQLLRDLEREDSIAHSFTFHIAPMHNVDGVISGNYRTNSDSINLETTWFVEPENPEMLRADAPIENQLLQMAMREAFLERSPGSVLLAINLHSANTAPDTPAFAFPHFGPEPERYSTAEQQLWLLQQRLIALINQTYAADFVAAGEAGRDFLQFAFPESWWWQYAGAESVALTIETSYARAGFPYWTTEDDIRALGEAFLEAAYRFHQPAMGEREARITYSSVLEQNEIRLKH